MGEKGKRVVVLSTRARGGILSVVEAHRAVGLYDRWNAEVLWTHCEGSLLKRLGAALHALHRYVVLLACGRVALVHAHIATRGSMWRKGVFIALARLRGIPVVLHLHGSEFKKFYEGQGRLLRRTVRAIFDISSHVVVLSEHWRRYLSGLTSTPVAVIHNFPARALEGGPNEGRVEFLFLGLFGARKGIHDLLEAVAKARGRVPGMKVYCGGNGDVEDARHRVAQLGISANVEILGWVSGAQKEALLRRCGIFVLPSYNEGLPMAIIEAMAAGMAIVSTPVGGIPELVDDGVNGRLVPPGDVASLAAALTELAADPELVRCYGAQSRARYIAAYSREAVLPDLERIYAYLVNGRAGVS
jgi:glycosyltransferase involved in cell wall biosynthesis